MNNLNIAKAEAATASGYRTVAGGKYSSTRGVGTMTTPVGGESTQMAIAATADGSGSIAGGDYSHAEGGNTVTNNITEHAEGNYNKSNYHSNNFGDALNTLHSVGCGTGAGALEEQDRRNAHEIMQNGDHYVMGIGGYDGTNPGEAETLQQRVNNPITVAEVDALDWELPTVVIGEHSYPVVRIGNLLWTAENLKEPLDEAVWYNNDKNTYEPLGYGMLYHMRSLFNNEGPGYDVWQTGIPNAKFQAILPQGWRVPTQAEIEEMITYIGGSEQGAKLLSTSAGGTDTYGFNAPKSGYYYWDNAFRSVNQHFYFLSSDIQYRYGAYKRGMGYEIVNAKTIQYHTISDDKMSVRLVKTA